MNVKFFLFYLIFVCSNLSSQVIVGFSQPGIGYLDLTYGNYTTLNNNDFGNLYSQGFATFDQIHQRYIYIVDGTGVYDTLVALNLHDGNVYCKKTFPKGRLFNPQYSEISDKVYGVSQSGFASFDLSSNLFSMINNVNYGNSFGQGLVTFDQINNRYIYTVNGKGNNDTLIVLNTSTGDFINKFPFPVGGLFNPEFSEKSNTVFGISKQGFASFNLTTMQYALVNNSNYGNSYAQGQATFDQGNNRYIYKVVGNVKDSIVTLDALTGAFVSVIPFSHNNLFNCEFSIKNFDFFVGQFEIQFETYSIYPNPFSNSIYINSNVGGMNTILINSLGQIVWEGSHINQVDFSYLPEGVYFLKAERQTIKLVKKSF